MQRIPLFLFLVSIGFLSALAKTPPTLEVVSAEVVTLDAVLVEASAASPWQIASTPNYVVLSRCPDAFNAAYLRALERSARAREAVLPEAYWYQLRTPVHLILFDQEPKRTDRFQLANPMDLTWSSDAGAIDGSKVIRRAHPLTVGDGDLFLSCGNYWDLKTELADLSVDPDSELRLTNRAPFFPAWFLAGMDGPYGVYGHRIIVGSGVSEAVLLPKFVWRSTEQTRALKDGIATARKRKQMAKPPELLPLAKLFAPQPPETDLNGWNSEAALFVRWALFDAEADGGARRAAFLRFLETAARLPVTEELFRSDFGMGFAEAEERLGAYLMVALDQTIRIPLRPAGLTPPRFREAASAEVARIIGTWARLQARALSPSYSDFRQECMDRADRLFQREWLKPNRDPSLLVEYGLYAAQTGKDDVAREALENAKDMGAIRPRAWCELARLRLTAALPSTPQGIGDLRASEYADILQLLSLARDRMPELMPTYNVLVQAMEHAPTTPSSAELEPLRMAAERFVRNTAFVYSVATLYRRCGYGKDAVRIAHRALPFAGSEKARAQLLSVTAD